MIRRILVALDPDSDTPVATRYAADVAKRYEAEVSGLAVVDLENIEADTRGGGIGSMYYAEKLRENLTEETRAAAERLIADFDRALEESGIAHSNCVEEGVPVRRIVEDLKYYDLLVIGREPHFFYGNPTQETAILAHVLAHAAAPALVVGTTYRPVRRVLIAYDGSKACARTFQSFVHASPFGADVAVEVLHFYQGDDDKAESTLMLQMAEAYLRAHGYTPTTTSRRIGDVAKQITEYAVETDADLVVVGAHVVSKFRRLAFGSTTAELLKNSPRPLFLHH